MFCEEIKDGIPNELSGLSQNVSRRKILIFIEECLPEFKKKYKFLKPEDGLTQELVYLLDNECREKLPICGFSTEHMEDTSKGNSRRDDIGVRLIRGTTIGATFYPNNKPFFVIEAKRLDSKIDKKRKKEYVVGRIKDSKYIESGGIERFKKEIHGFGLTYVGMIGYIQTEDFDVWLEKINEWIKEEIKSPSSAELSWSRQDTLNPVKKNTLFSTYDSKHKCKSKEIDMYHIWVKLI